MEFSWTSVAFGGQITAGSQVAVAFPFRKQGNTALVRVRIRFENADRFAWMRAGINDFDRDEDIHHTVNQLLAFSSSDDGKWVEVASPSGGHDISAFGDGLRVTFTAQGTENTAKVSVTVIKIEQVIVEQW